MNYDDTVDFKVNCNSAEYFKLFEPYIPKLKLGSKALLYSISNVDCLKNIIDKNQDCVYYIYDTNVIFDVLKLINENNNVILVNDISELNMKFDCIIMNPPYQRNLHLKILEKAISMLKDDNSVCVNLSPDTWLHEFADVNKRSDYNKFSKLPFKSINRLGLLNRYFDLGHTTYTGAIYVCTKKQTSYNIETELYSDIILPNKTTMPKTLNKKIKRILVEFVNTYSSLESHIVTGNPDKTTKWSRYIPRLVGNPGERCSCLASINSKRWDKTFYCGKFEGKTFSETKKQLSNVKNYSEFDYVEFDTERHAINWRNSCDTSFMKYVCTLLHVDANRHANWIPWMEDVINPRTGLKGYEGEWTNEDFYKFFNITEDEQKIIEETMKKYS